MPPKTQEWSIDDEASTFASLLRYAVRTDADSMTLAVGDRLCDQRFTILARVGGGGMGTVYAAHDETTGTDVAVKMMRRQDALMFAALKREFRATEGLHHPHLVRLGELLVDGDRWLFTMELVHGERLREWVRGHPRRLRKAMAELAEALCAVHRHGRVHRDVKPSNVMVTHDSRTVLLDFGIALFGDAAIWTDSDAAGTRAYMSPEQAAGERVSAASDWYSFGVVLRELLATAPKAPDLERLLRRLIDPDPACRASGEEIVAALRQRTSPLPTIVAETHPFVGRTEELNRIDDALQRVRGGTSRALLIRGASGVGKTALIDEVVRRAPDDVLVLRGRCREREAIPFKGIEEIVDAMIPILTAEDAPPVSGAELLCASFPALANVSGWRFPIEERASSTDTRQRLLHRAFQAVVQRCARARTPMLIIDDLQWVDADSLGLLDALTTMNAPLLLLLLGRSRTATPRLAIDVDDTTLGPLDEAHARELVEHLGSGPTQMDRIVRETDGHPFHIVELAHHARRGATDLDDALRSRMTDLDADATHLLALCVTDGARIQRSVLMEAAAVPRDRFMSSMAALVDERWIASSGTQPSDLVEPAHDRVRESIGASLSAPFRARLHAALATALSGEAALEHERIGMHLIGAGEPNRAHTHLIQAAKQAMRVGAYDHAATLYDHGLDLDPSAAETLAEAHADALAAAARPLDAAEKYLLASQHAPHAKQRLESRAARQLVLGGETERGYALAETILFTGRLQPPKRARHWGVWLLLSEIQVRIRGTDFTPGRATPDEAARMDLIHAMGSAMALVDGLRGTTMQLRGLLLALRVGDARQVCRSLALVACMRAATRKFDQARRLTRLAETLDAHDGRALASAPLMTLAFQEGRFADAVEIGLKNHDEHRSAYTAWDIATNTVLLLSSCFHSGRLELLRDMLDRATSDATKRRDKNFDLSLSATTRPLVCLLDDDPDAALRSLARARHGLWRGGVGQVHAWMLFIRILIALYVDEASECARVVERAPWCHYGRLTGELNYADLMTTYARGRLAMRLGNPAAARPHVQRLRQLPTAMAGALADLLEAALTAGRARQRLLQHAAHHFQTANLKLWHALTQGEVAGDPAAQSRSDQDLRSLGVRDPQRFARAFIH